MLHHQQWVLLCVCSVLHAACCVLCACFMAAQLVRNAYWAVTACVGSGKCSARHMHHLLQGRTLQPHQAGPARQASIYQSTAPACLQLT